MTTEEVSISEDIYRTPLFYSMWEFLKI